MSDGGSLPHESCGKGGKGENGAINRGDERGGGGSRDDWAGGGVGVWSNLLNNRLLSFTHV